MSTVSSPTHSPKGADTPAGGATDRHRRRRARLVSVAAASVTLAAAALAPAPAGASVGAPLSSTANAARTAGVPAAAAAAARVRSIPISFTVRNVNRSRVACPSDGKTYTVRGHLVAPAGGLRGGPTRTATLYLHGLGFGEFFWDFTAVGGYDYAAAQARAGQVSVVVDRLGYGASSRPDGNAICVGSRADIAHQMVSDLRSGHYVLGGRAPVRFGRIVLAGHSHGAQIAQVEAYSFGGINGLVLIGYADRVQSVTAQTSLAYANLTCAAGGRRATPRGPAHYTSFGFAPAAPKALFADVGAGVLEAALPRLSIDPCGDTAFFAKAVSVDLRDLRRVQVPVLIVEGAADALFPPPAARSQAALFTGARSVSTTVVPLAGHAITLERHHRVLERAVRVFLSTRVTSRQ